MDATAVHRSGSEAAGYKVFADIFDLDAGDEWRGKLTAALQTRAIKMLLCCSDETLARRGVREEIAIAEDLTKQLRDPNFIIPLKVRTFKKLFGIGGLQYVDFESGWAKGLGEPAKSLERQQVPKAGGRYPARMVRLSPPAGRGDRGGSRSSDIQLASDHGDAGQAEITWFRATGPMTRCCASWALPLNSRWPNLAMAS